MAVAAVRFVADFAVRPVVVVARLAVVVVARAEFLAEVAVPLAPDFAALVVDATPGLALRAVSFTPLLAVEAAERTPVARVRVVDEPVGETFGRSPRVNRAIRSWAAVTVPWAMPLRLSPTRSATPANQPRGSVRGITPARWAECEGV